MNKFTHIVTGIAFATLAATISQPAAADDSYVVTYRAAELQTEDGMRSLHQRIRDVAKRHCPSYSRTPSLADIRSCREDVVKDLVESIGDPRFIAFIDRSNEHSEPVSIVSN